MPFVLWTFKLDKENKKLLTFEVCFKNDRKWLIDYKTVADFSFLSLGLTVQLSFHPLKYPINIFWLIRPLLRLKLVRELKLHEVKLHEPLKCNLSHTNRCNRSDKVTKMSVKHSHTHIVLKIGLIKINENTCVSGPRVCGFMCFHFRSVFKFFVLKC